jgi:hypothetical protein
MNRHDARALALAYSVGSTLGLIVGAVVGSTLIDEARLRLETRKAMKR